MYPYLHLRSTAPTSYSRINCFIKSFLRKSKFIAFAIASFFFVSVAFGQTWYLTTPGQGSAQTIANWKQNLDGTGSTASNFTADGQTFIIPSDRTTAVWGASITFGNTGNNSLVTLQVDGVLTINSGVLLTFSGKMSKDASSMIVNGTIVFSDASNSQITLPISNSFNSFTLAATATLKTKNTNGIFGNASSSIIKATAAVVTLNAANYEFNGTTQSTLGLPTTAINGGVTVATGATVTSTNAIIINTPGTLTINGTLISGAATQVFSGTGSLTGSGTVQVTRIAATPDFSSQYTITTKTLTNLTVDYAGAGAQTINSTVGNYGAIKTSGSGVKTVDGALTINGGLTIGSSTTFAAGTFTHNIGGDFTNNGTFTANTSTINFNGSTSLQTISGSSTTSFNNITVNKGADVTKVLEANGAGVISNTGNITITNGLFKMTTGTFQFNATVTIPSTGSGSGGIHVNGASLNSGGFSYTNKGLIRITSGSAIFGTSAGNSVTNQNVGLFDIQGGAVSIAGRLENTGNGTPPTGYSSTGVSISGGTLTVAKVAYSNNGTSSFDMSTTSNLNISGGTIIFQNTNSGTAGDLVVLNGGTKTITGGTFQLGNANTPNAKIFSISSAIPIYNLSVNGSAFVATKPAALLANSLAVNNGLTLDAGTILSIASNTLTLNGAVSGTGTLSTTSSSNLTIGGATGTLLFTAGTNTIKNLSINTGASATLGNALNVTGGSTPGIVTSTGTGSLTTGGFLTFKSDVNGTGMIGTSTGTISGNVTIERYIPARRAWRFLSVPINATTQTIKAAWQEGQASNANSGPAGYGTHITNGNTANANGFDFSNVTGNSIKVWDLTTNNWSTTAIANTTPTLINARDAYSLFVRGDRSVNLTQGSTAAPTVTTLRITGTPNVGTITKNFTTTSGYFVFMGNPFVSPVDFGLLTKSNVENKYWVWDPKLSSYGAYVSFDVTSTTKVPGGASGSYPAFTKIIQSGQAFFVKSTAASGSVAFPENSKDLTQQNVFRGGKVFKKLYINLEQADTANNIITFDGVAALFARGLSKTVDGEDVGKLINFNENLALYRTTKDLSIEKRPEIKANDTLFLDMWALKKQAYRFTFTPEAFTNPALTAFLEDDYLKTSTPVSLTNATTVGFLVNDDAASFNRYRFRVVFKLSSTLPVSFLNVKAYKKPGAIQVEWNMSDEENIKQYDVERSSNGQTFLTTANLVSKGGVALSHYDWLDMHPVNGDNYYRIKAISITGETKYSGVALVKEFVTGSSIYAYPNPVKNNNLNIVFANKPEGKYSLTLFNMQGVKVFSRDVTYTGGYANISVTLQSKFTAGAYQLQVTNGKEKKLEKIIIQ